MKIKSVIVKAGDLFDMCGWWKAHESQWPSLARMAFDMMAIPAMSSECERLFSSAKLLLSDHRARKILLRLPSVFNIGMLRTASTRNR